MLFRPSVLTLAPPHCFIFHVKAQNRLASTTYWKHLQKRTVWLAWQQVYKSLIILIPCPVDSYLTLAFYHSATKCVRMQSDCGDRGVLFLSAHAGRMAGLKPCRNVALLQPLLLP